MRGTLVLKGLKKIVKKEWEPCLSKFPITINMNHRIQISSQQANTCSKLVIKIPDKRDKPGAECAQS